MTAFCKKNLNFIDFLTKSFLYDKHLNNLRKDLFYYTFYRYVLLRHSTTVTVRRITQSFEKYQHLKMMPEWVNGVHYESLQGRFVRLLKESLYSSFLMFTR